MDYEARCGCCLRAPVMWADPEYLEGVCNDCSLMLQRERALDHQEVNIEHDREQARLSRDPQ